jgi:hypothetical protein
LPGVVALNFGELLVQGLQLLNDLHAFGSR